MPVIVDMPLIPSQKRHRLVNLLSYAQISSGPSANHHSAYTYVKINFVCSHSSA